MARGRSVTPAQEKDVVSLYQQGKELKEIMKETGIKSEKTIYSLLDQNKIPRRSTLKGVPKTFYLEEDVISILNQQPNKSRFVNEAIRYYNRNKTNDTI